MGTPAGPTRWPQSDLPAHLLPGEVGDLLDGIRVDTNGNVWSSSHDSVQVFSPDGTRIERIAVPEKIPNLCFGGVAGTTLFITATTSLYRIETTAHDAAAALRDALRHN